MSDKKLPTFKAGDKQRPQIASRSGRPTGPQQEAPQNPSSGFARLETLLDSELPGEVATRFQSLAGELDKIIEAAKNPKAKAQPRRAKAAISLTMDLVAHLFNTKAGMAQTLTQGQKGGPETKASK